MTKLKQFNFKIPNLLYDQLESAAKARGTKMTSLVIQGIRQVLGISATSPEINVDLDIYPTIDKINLRLDKLEQSQVDIATRLYQYIPELEHDLTQLKEGIPAADVVNSIAEIVYTKITEDVKRLISESIASSIALNIDKNSIAANVDKNIAYKTQQESQILLFEKPESSSTQSEGIEKTHTFDNSLPREIQIKIPGIENSVDDIANKAEKVNSIELLKVLKSNDPKGKWDNSKLTSYRRNKKYKDKWHRIGHYQFKYANEIDENKVPGASKHLHVWWLVQNETKKEITEYSLEEPPEQVGMNHEKTETHSDL